MIISAIVATDQNHLIGLNNRIPWYLSADLKFFKRTTLGHHILMGRKSFLSIGRPLPKRTNVVITRDPFFAATGCLVVHSIEEGLALAQDNGEEEVFIIGGGQIYAQSREYWDRLYLTEVQAEVPVKEEQEAVYFPDLDWEQWKLLSEEAHEADEKNDHPFVFKKYQRRKS